MFILMITLDVHCMYCMYDYLLKFVIEISPMKDSWNGIHVN